MKQTLLIKEANVDNIFSSFAQIHAKREDPSGVCYICNANFLYRTAINLQWKTQLEFSFLLYSTKLQNFFRIKLA